MGFTTYQNHQNPHVTVHLNGCTQIAKRGGVHKQGQGKYATHPDCRTARTYAESTQLEIRDCSYCLGKVPPEVRLFPMNRELEFPSYTNLEEVQERYFLTELPFEQRGEFYCRSATFSAPKGTSLLFQCEGSVIAGAVLLGVEELDESEAPYRRKLLLEPGSIRTWSPIGANELRMVWPEFKQFGQGTTRLSPQQYPQFLKLIVELRSLPFLLPEERAAAESKHYVEGAKLRVIVNAYERNNEARQACLDHYGAACIACGFNFEKAYGPGVKGIHVHHLRLLSECGGEYKVDPIEDLRPVCPNCHAVIHSRNPPLRIDEVVAMLAGVPPVTPNS
jgi:hypothetical protein